MKNMNLVFRVLLCYASLFGCATKSSLESEVEKLGYVPLEPPTSASILGAIIDFKAGYQSTTAFPSECLYFLNSALRLVPDPVDVAVPVIVEKVDKNVLGNFSVPSELVKYVNLDAALTTKESRMVRIVLNEPFTIKFSRLGFRSYRSQIRDVDQRCESVLRDKENLVLHDVLGAKTIEYELVDESGTVVKFDASIMDKAKANADIDLNKSTAEKLVTNKPMFVGYKAWIATKASGFVGSDFVPVTVDEVRALRAASRRRLEQPAGG